MFTFLNDAEDDPFFGPHMRHMRQMNNMMSSLMADPFGMFGGGGMLGVGGNMLQSRPATSLMPFMPPMNMNRLVVGNMQDGMMAGSSYSSSTVVMSSGPNGRPQVISTTSSTKVGPNGIKETRKTLEDSRTGTKKMAVGHHIGERAHVIEREQNLLSGDQEETQEFINLDEDEAEDFNREFQQKAGGYVSSGRPRLAPPPPAPPALLAITAPPAASAARDSARPAPRPPLRRHGHGLRGSHGTPHRSSATVRELYSGAQPRHRARHQRPHHPHHAPRHADH